MARPILRSCLRTSCIRATQDLNEIVQPKVLLAAATRSRSSPNAARIRSAAEASTAGPECDERRFPRSGHSLQPSLPLRSRAAATPRLQTQFHRGRTAGSSGSWCASLILRASAAATLRECLLYQFRYHQAQLALAQKRNRNGDRRTTSFCRMPCAIVDQHLRACRTSSTKKSRKRNRSSAWKPCRRARIHPHPRSPPRPALQQNPAAAHRARRRFREARRRMAGHHER